MSPDTIPIWTLWLVRLRVISRESVTWNKLGLFLWRNNL